MDFLKRLWAAEPLLVAAGGSVPVWLALFELARAFGYPLTEDQKHAVIGVLTAVGVIVGRSQVTAPDTLQTLLKSVGISKP